MSTGKVPRVNLLDPTVEPSDEEPHALMTAVRDSVVVKHQAWLAQAAPEQVAELHARKRAAVAEAEAHPEMLPEHMGRDEPAGHGESPARRRQRMTRCDEAQIKVEPKRPAEDTLQAYAEGMIGRDEAIRRVGVRDYADLLVALGDAGLSPPRPPKHQIENEAATFARIWEST